MLTMREFAGEEFYKTVMRWLQEAYTYKKQLAETCQKERRKPDWYEKWLLNEAKFTISLYEKWRDSCLILKLVIEL